MLPVPSTIIELPAAVVAATATTAGPVPTLQPMPAAAPAPAAAPSVPLLPPAGIYANFVTVGAGSAKYTPFKTLFLGVYAGLYISLGAFVASCMLAGCPGDCCSRP